MDKELKYVTNLIMGDQWDDGHGKMRVITLDSNLTSEEIALAYEKGKVDIGVDLCSTVATEYEDNHISETDINKFIKAGYKWDFEELPIKDEQAFIYEGVFSDLYFFTVLKGNECFKYKIHTKNEIPIGGYGLFD